MKVVILIGVLLVLTSFVSAEFGYNNIDGPILTPDPTTFDNDTAWVNASSKWVTEDHGPLSRVDDILHNWLDATSLLWSNAGHIMDTVLDMNFNDIDDVAELTTENITLGGYIKDNNTNIAGVISEIYYDSNGGLVIAG